MSSPEKKICCLNENEYDCFVTPWSFIHMLSGYMLALVIFILCRADTATIIILANIIHACYEVKDYTNTYVINDRVAGNIDDDSWGNNSLFNSVGDQLFCNVGVIIFMYVKPFLVKIDTFKFLIINLLCYSIILSVFKKDMFLDVDIG